MTRLRLIVRGMVQGVGFRPFAYRLARQLKLSGWVCNSNQGVFIEVEGPAATLQSFLLRLPREKPAHASVQSLESSWLDPVGYHGFEIRPSAADGAKTALVMPDIATCPDCCREIFDPADRRYRYPFTNCTHCGPRFSIIQALPYDRPHTSMQAFKLCTHCQIEYDDPLNRRFHAQPTACPDCGPHIEFWDPHGTLLGRHDDALRQTAEAIRHGRIVAVKGLGGFHLMVDARSEDAVHRLRARKRREEKPFALMIPSLDAAAAWCDIRPLETRLLASPEAPIVLLRRHARNPGPPHTPWICEAVAPGNPDLGVMLPYTPLHHLLMAELRFPVVATSGNLSDEPICTDEYDALERLGGVAEFFLVHNRPIVRHVDDSIVRLMLNRELVLRRARGYAPLPISLPSPVPTVLAVGAHLKSTIALAVGRQVFLSQHIGDLENESALRAFRAVAADLPRLYDVQPSAIVADAHPDYLSTQFAAQSGTPVRVIQHHAAHVFACMAENELTHPALGVAWDGTGYGLDGTIWGGEFFRVSGDGIQRVAHFRTFPLPGGEAAAKEPRRVALGLLFELAGPSILQNRDLLPVRAFSAREIVVLSTALARGINTPRTSSVGRLFDAVASLLGLRQVYRHEGQAAMELEFAQHGSQCDAPYGIELRTDAHPLVIDWAPMIREILQDVQRGTPAGAISARFHHTLAQTIIRVAKHFGETRVVLSGGCFQNLSLTESAVRYLTTAGIQAYWHQRVPPNDGGIALGQAAASLYLKNTTT